jgi:uncharacterized membrane protein YqjE
MDAEVTAEVTAERSASATGLFRSASNFIATLLSIARTRLELLTTELQEEVRETAKLLMWALIAAFAAMMALLLGSLTVVFVFWETHRVLASVLVTVMFVALAIGAVFTFVAKLRRKPPMLDATLSELAKDRDQLRSHL